MSYVIFLTASYRHFLQFSENSASTKNHKNKVNNYCSNVDAFFYLAALSFNQFVSTKMPTGLNLLRPLPVHRWLWSVLRVTRIAATSCKKNQVENTMPKLLARAHGTQSTSKVFHSILLLLFIQNEGKRYSTVCVAMRVLSVAAQVI